MTHEPKPDFDALRNERNEKVVEMVKSIAKERGWDASGVLSTHNPDACYCACPDGPCEHDFQGWRPIYDDNDNECGGETVCTRCGCGAMHHSLMTSE